MSVSRSIARIGRSRKRFEWLAASSISLRPMLVIWSTFCPKAGELTSCATRSSINPSTRSPSFDFCSVDSGTRPAAFSGERSEEHTSELQSLMRISYAVFCLKKKTEETSIHKSVISQTDRHDEE